MNDKTQGAANPGFGAGLGAFVPGFDFLQKLAAGQVGASDNTGNAGPVSLADWIAPTLDLKVLEQRIAELKAVQFWLEQNAAALKATLQALEVQKMTLAALQGMGGAGGTDQADAAGKKAAPESMHAAQAMQYWTALTQQFQTIAAQAMKDMAAMKSPAPTSAAAAQTAGQSDDVPPNAAGTTQTTKASSAKTTRGKAGNKAGKAKS